MLHRASDTMRTLPGFVSANLHVPTGRKRAVNYAQWRRWEDFDTMRKMPKRSRT